MTDRIKNPRHPRSPLSSLPSTLCPTHSDSETSDDSGFQLVAQKQRQRGPLHLGSDTRAVLTNTITATYLMKELDSQEIIASQSYFGRYGKINKVIISSTHSSFSRHNEHVQCYITYEDSLDSALAILAIHNMLHHTTWKVKAHYGASKYCESFLLGFKCKRKDCYLLHQEQQWNMTSGQLKKSSNQQYRHIYKTINQNLPAIVKKIYQEHLNRQKMNKNVMCLCETNSKDIQFRSIKDTIQIAIDDGKVNHYTFQRIKDQFKQQLKIKPQLELLPLTQLNGCQSFELKSSRNFSSGQMSDRSLACTQIQEFQFQNKYPSSEKSQSIGIPPNNSDLQPARRSRATMNESKKPKKYVPKKSVQQHSEQALPPKQISIQLKILNKMFRLPIRSSMPFSLTGSVTDRQRRQVQRIIKSGLIRD